STLGSNRVCEVEGREVRELDVTPEQAGLPRARLEDLKGADSAYNAQRLQALLEGQRDAYRDIVLFGAAAALQIAGKVGDLKSGVALAAAAIDQGRALQNLEA